MSRAENRIKMGYFALNSEHHTAVTSLIAPGTPTHKLFDPFAGEGVFLEAAASRWNLTPYANELDGERAAACIEKFGPRQAVRCDAERLQASRGAFSVIWCNPPYDHAKTDTTASKRVEFKLLRHSWKWLHSDGGIMLWAVYRSHITEEAAAFLAKNSTSVDVWALPGKHLNEYDQVVVVARAGVNGAVNTTYQHIMNQREEPQLLTVQDEPVYTLPAPPAKRRFVFTPDMLDEVQALALIEDAGAQGSNAFEALLAVQLEPSQRRPVVPPRPGHLALALSGGVANGAIIDTADYGWAAVRSKIVHVEEAGRVESEPDPKDPEQTITRTVMRLKPKTTITLLTTDGKVVEMSGDEAILGFIRDNREALVRYLNDAYAPIYDFDFAGIGSFLRRLRVKGKYPLYVPQMHVIAAVVRGFEERDGILLVGQMGVGKTSLASSVAIAAGGAVASALSENVRGDQVTLVVCPPHLVEKWARELRALSGNLYVSALQRHEDVKKFMAKAAKLGPGIPKVGIIKRDATKLGQIEPAMRWRNEPVALWRPDADVPPGWEDKPRVVREQRPKCPGCGRTVTFIRNDREVVATKAWLKGKRECRHCGTQLWQETRLNGSKPKPGERLPRRNPRYPLAEYIQRQYPDRVHLLVWDELHEAANADTGVGTAFSRLAGIADKVLGLTGTPFNGKASSLFNIEYVLNPSVRHRYNWGPGGAKRGKAEARWVGDMGVRERVLEERPQYHPETGVYTGVKTYERPYSEAAGCSPLLPAELLDHAIFFSLRDLDKWLPTYEESAVPVEMDDDVRAAYDRTRDQLKDYLIARKWEGDSSFRGAYLQWNLSWPNAPFRPTEVIHNQRSPITGKVSPTTVTKLPSYGEARVFAKEQALIDLVRDELAGDRPCVVYVRQSGTKDIQPRLESLLREHIPGAVPFILRSSVAADRREKVIDAEVAKGANVVITHPDLVRTGLDLVFAPTLIHYEPVLSLPTLMQASARSYRLNQEHKTCKVIYLFYADSMEHRMIQLMSRKQRAAKLLTGDTGLTGLDAITEGEAGLEQALLQAVGEEEALVDPRQLFAASDGADDAIGQADAAYWNVDGVEVEPTAKMTTPPSLVTLADELGATLTPVSASEARPRPKLEPRVVTKAARTVFVRQASAYLAAVTRVHDPAERAKLQAELLGGLLRGTVIQKRGADFHLVGLESPDYTEGNYHERHLRDWAAKWLRSKRFLSDAETADAVAGELIVLGRGSLGLTQTVEPVVTLRKRRSLDRMAVPENAPPPTATPKRKPSKPSGLPPQQLPMFPVSDPSALGFGD